MTERTRFVERIIFSTDDSAVPITITFPSPLRQHELQDLKALMEIFYRSQERRGSDSDHPERGG
jgi:hypothetical protein